MRFPSPLFSRLRRRRLGRRSAFAQGRWLVVRTVMAIGASVALLVLSSQTFYASSASRELVQQDARSVAADSLAVETAYKEGSDRADGMDDALDLVDSMEDRFGVVSARLLDSRGRVVRAPRDANFGADAPHPVQPRRPRYDEVTTRDHGNRLGFLVPVDIAGQRFMLDVEQDGKMLRSRVAALRDETLVFSIFTLLIAVAMFYLLGGRALTRRHRSVVRRATRDPLTDLGNHRTFQETLAHATRSAAGRREPVAVALIDLDEFKLVNDRFGHRRGDEVLKTIAQILADGRPDDIAFRIGGDEFALLLPGADGARARLVVERCLNAARADPRASSFTAGIAVLDPAGEPDPAVLWEQADAALYEGKRSGGGMIVVFDDVAELLTVVTPAKMHALRSLLDEPRVEIAFQPIWQLQEGRLLGLEALARPADDYGFDGPQEMFAVAEKIGRAHELDSVCRAAALARAHELPDGALLFLNVNPQSLTHDTLGGDRLLRAVAAAGLEPSQVVLEITERSDARLNHVIADATRLRRLGFRLALDDVGTGNAGLEMLRELEVDFVKIDRSVIAAAVNDKPAQAVLFAILAYARRADAFVIAEGIESESMLEFVRDPGELDIMRSPSINGGQGFLLGRPSEDLSHLAETMLPQPVA